MARVSFPVDLGGGLAVNDASLKAYFSSVERGGGGFFPLGVSGTWHGGVHLYADEKTPVHAMADGWVVACRLKSDPDALKGPFGSTNFILVRHETRGRVFNRVARGLKSRTVYTWFSLYMHVGGLPAETGTPELAKVSWLSVPYEDKEIVGSVGRGGRNRKADVRLVQTLLTRAGANPGPIDGLIGPKTRGGITEFQEKFLYSNPDGRIDVGGSTWRALVHAAAGTPEKLGFDEELLGKVGGGELVICNKPVGAGDPLWIVGPDADEETHLVHWEVFSGDNLISNATQVADEAAFQADPMAIASALNGKDWFGPENPPTARNIARFYGGNAAAKGLRDVAARFRSEWALDLPAAIEAMKPHVFTEGLAEQIKPYQWFELAAAANLPDPTCWHYHPVRFAGHLAKGLAVRALPVYPPPPPAQHDDPPDSDAEVPEPPQDEIMLYDAGSDLVYIVSKGEYDRLLRANAKLRQKKQALESAMKAAKNLSRDQRANAVKTELDELLELTNAPSNSVSNMDGVGSSPNNGETKWLSEVWVLARRGGKRPLYIAPIARSRMERTARERKPLKEMYKAENKGVEFKFELIDDDMKKKYPWLQGGGSLLDFVDSANPGLLGTMLSPLRGADAFFERYPRLFRKGYQGKWQSKSGNMNTSGEARLLRWGYETKLGGVISPKDGKAEFRGTLGGSVDLVSGKCEANWFVPHKGYMLPLTVGDGIRVRFHVKGEVTGSVGVAAQLSAGAAVQWKPDPDDAFVGARADAGIELFAGAKITGKLTLALQWFAENKWSDLAAFSVAVTGIAGAALVAKAIIDFDPGSGVFIFHAKGQLALKLGVGVETVLEIHAWELLKFLKALMLCADWGHIAELSGRAFYKASEMLVASAISGSPLVGITYGLARSFSSWWNDQDKITNLAENINNGRASVLLNYGTPEAKGMTIHRLCDVNWMWDEDCERAALRVLKSGKSRREVEKILKSIDPEGRDSKYSASRRAAARTVERGYDLMSGLVDWSEQEELDNFLISKGIRV